MIELDKCKELIEQYDLNDLFTDDIIIKPSELINEARDNLVSISFEQEDLITAGHENLSQLIERIIDSKRQILHKKQMSMIFYLWYDEQANSILYSLVSALDPKLLPFACKIELTSDIKKIINILFEKSANYDLSLSNFEHNIENELTDENDKNYVLSVFYKKLP